MEINKSKTTIKLIFLYLVILTIVIIGYFALSNNQFNSFANAYASENQEVNSQNLNEVINNEFNYYLNNDSLSNVVATGTIINNTIEYAGTTVNLINNNLDIYNLAIKDNYLFLINNSEYGVLIFDELLEKLLLPSKANNVLIMDNTGLIYYNSNDNSEILSNYLKGNTTSYINDYFSLNKDGVIKDQVNDEDIFLSFHHLDDYKNIYLMESFAAKDIMAFYSPYNIIFLIFILIYTVLIIGTQIYIYRSIHIKNAEIEKYKIKYFYSKPYIIKINFKGKIKRFNSKIKKEIENIKSYKNIENFKLINNRPSQTALDLVTKEESFTVQFAEKHLRFIPVKYCCGYHLIGEEVTSLEEENKNLQLIAYYNDVTKQPNHHYLLRDLKEHIRNPKYDYTKTGIVMLDISGFSFINKVFGRETGNVVLRELNKQLTILAKPLNGFVYNVTEDKFVVLFKENKEKIETLLKTLFELAEKPLKIDHNSIKVDLNAGVYYFEEKDKTPEEVDNILKALTLAFKKAKQSSLSNYIIYDSELKSVESKDNIMHKDLIKAIEDKEIAVYLQPQYDNDKQKIVGFEALTRWENPKYINVSPLKYIILAEQNNLIIPLGKVIMEKTFLLAQKLKEFDVTISMNVSPAQLAQDGFVDEFLTMYNKYNLKAGSIALEVTETFLISSLKETNRKMRLLRENGIAIHLDDFGVGYSSLSYLRELSIDSVKIDRSFIQHLETDKQDREIVKMIIGLVKSLDYEVIAEGVETEYQNNFLYKNGCNIVQGFILSPALPYEGVLKLLNEYNVDKSRSLKVEKRRRDLL